MKSLNVAVLSFALSLSACGGDGDGSGGLNACDFIAGNSYSSVTELECGVNVTCRWNIYFETSGRYQWKNSDTLSSGSYTCSGLSIKREGKKIGSYDPDTATVTWRDQDYQ